MFGKNDPIHMGTLHIASLTLFRCATLEDWTDVMYIAMEGCENYGYDGNEELCTNNNPTPLMSVIYFCSFIILSSMMILNLFIGVITSSMQDAKTELSADLEDEEEVDEEEVRGAGTVARVGAHWLAWTSVTFLVETAAALLAR